MSNVTPHTSSRVLTVSHRRNHSVVLPTMLRHARRLLPVRGPHACALRRAVCSSTVYGGRRNVGSTTSDGCRQVRRFQTFVAVAASNGPTAAAGAATADAAAAVKKLRREEYRPSSFGIPSVALHVDLHDTSATVSSRFTLEREPWCIDDAVVLDGDASSLSLVGVWANDKPLARGVDFTVTDTSLVIAAAKLFPDARSDFASLRIDTALEPHKNTALQGLYKSKGGFFTQMEARGFSRLTYWLDRPGEWAGGRTPALVQACIPTVLPSPASAIDAFG